MLQLLTIDEAFLSECPYALPFQQSLKIFFFAHAKLIAIRPQVCPPERNGPQGRWLPNSESDTDVICKLGLVRACLPPDPSVRW